MGEVINGYRVAFWGDENMLELVVRVAQNCEYTTTCSAVHFEVSKRVSGYVNFSCLTCTHVTTVSALSSHAVLPCVCLSTPSSCKDTSHWIGAHPDPLHLILIHLTSTELILSPETLFPNKVNF